jgi:hypothetical protein
MHLKMFWSMLPAMDAVTSSSTVKRSSEKVQRRWLGLRLFTALAGAFGFGLELDRTMSDMLNPRLGAQAMWAEHILLGVMFLLVAVVHSRLLLSEIRKEPREQGSEHPHGR